jgi:hypothetical protein
MELDFVRVACQDQQLTVSIFRIRDFQIPVIRIKEDAVRFAAQSREGLSEENGMTERRAVGRIQTVRVIRPIDPCVAFGRGCTARRI